MIVAGYPKGPSQALRGRISEEPKRIATVGHHVADAHTGVLTCLPLVRSVLYHYTAATNLPSILDSGVLRLADAYISASERPAVWFSSNPIWEATATKFRKTSTGVRPMTLEEMRESVGLLRIAVADASAPVTWEEFKKVSGIKLQDAKVLERSGIQMGGTPSEWYASFEPVPSNQWLSVEAFLDGQWQSLGAPIQRS